MADVIKDLQQWQARLGPVAEGEPPPDDYPRSILRSTVRYLANNAHRMDYAHYRRDGLPVTSSQAESLVKQISKRVKGTEKFLTTASPAKPSSNSVPPSSATTPAWRDGFTLALYPHFPQDATVRLFKPAHRNYKRVPTPRGIIQQRVQEAGPQRFAVVSIDCGKAASKWMMCDFYARVLMPPQEVEHARMQMQLATVQVKEACREPGIRDTIVAVEMTGTYHRPIQRAFRQAGFETRLVHPFASSHYRLPSHGDNKTDDNDLEAIFRAAVNGFGLLEPEWDETYLQLQLLARRLASQD